MRILFFWAFLFSVSNLFAQSTKEVELVVVGKGINENAALQNAFKTAIVQSFGTYITTKTEILNDEIAKDEMVLVSNGNIQKYEILSTANLNQNEVSVTVKVTVSLSNLVSFVNSKGFGAQIKGSLLSANIQQQEFNELNEIKATTELVNTLTSVLNKSFDYSVKLDEPKSDGENKWNVPIMVNVQTNQNINIFKDYLLKSMSGISMSPTEAANYIKLNKPIYKISIGDESYFEGNGVSRDLFIVSNKSTLTKNNVPKIEINKLELKKLATFKDKNFYICYSLSGNYEGSGLDTLFATTNNIEAEIVKINELLNIEAERKLRSSSYTYYTPDMMKFYPIVYWTSQNFIPPVYYFRKLESVQLFYNLIESDLKDILFNFKIKNEIKDIEGKILLEKFQDVKNRRAIQFLENDFKLHFNYIYHEPNQIGLPVRSKYFIHQINLSERYSENTSIDINEYWNFQNTYYDLIKANSNFGNSNNVILRNNFENFNYPFIDFIKFSTFLNPGTISVNYNRTVNYNRNKFRQKNINDFVLLLTLDSFKTSQSLFSFKFLDTVTKDQLSKISNYTIEHN